MVQKYTDSSLQELHFQDDMWYYQEMAVCICSRNSVGVTPVFLWKTLVK